ncbi:MAG TPA: hypothetical protein VHZ95_22185 [Polyangiales bacterium]|jgi:hypothetical protein|nr:hypothetical protein [Polyangiales bacterium]
MAKLNASLPGEAPAAAPKPTEPAAKTPEPAAPAKLADAKPETHVAPEPTDAKHDPATDRGLRAVEQARKKFLDEQNAWKAEQEVQRAETARLRAEAQGKVSSVEELKKLKASEILDRLALDDDGYDAMSRHAYARTKQGKADPRAAAAVADAERSQASRGQAETIAELQAKIDKLEQGYQGEFKRRDQQTFAEHWVGEAVKSVPTDKPTLIGKLMAKSPDAGRAQLLAIGAELERANDGEQPTHSEVIAEFEKRRRAALEEQGVDVDALLAPAKAPTAPAPRTLDVTATKITRNENAPQTREERRAVAQANLRARQRQTADQA